MKHNLVVSLNNVKFEKDKLCSACQAGKQVANTHPTKSVMSTERTFELLHMNLFGPTTYRSIGGNCYCLVVVDDYSRYTWVFFFSWQGRYLWHIQEIHNKGREWIWTQGEESVKWQFVTP